MRIEDEKVLATFRSSGRCERCGRCVYPLDPHHAFIKTGMGGGRRLDVRENVIALCRLCHGKAETSTAFNEECREVIAKRESTSVSLIFETLWELLRRDKYGLDTTRQGEEAGPDAHCDRGPVGEEDRLADLPPPDALAESGGGEPCRAADEDFGWLDI